MAIALIAGLAAMGSAAIAGIAWSFAAFALGAGLSMVSRALAPKMDMGSQMGGRSVMTREAAHSRKIVYGRARIGGNVVYLESTGDDNKYLWLVVAVAGHEIDAYESVWFNDKKIWDAGSYVGTWGSYVDISFHEGDQTTADTGLVAASTKWTTDHKLLDTAYMVVKLTYDRDQFAQGLPNISTIIRGKKVLNPNGGATAWSQNPALCIYDYLRDTKYGLGETTANILTASVNTAKDVCDEAIDLDAGGTQPRYTMDGVIDTAGSLKSNIELMTGAMAGRLVYSGGQFELHAGEYIAPTITVDESQIVGEITVQTKQSRRNAFNGVKGVFLSEDDNYILADYPAQISSAYAVQDGDPIYLDMALPFTVNNIRAQRLAKLALLRSRQQEAITIPCNLSALRFKIGDNINVTNARLGYSNKIFEVVGYSMAFSADGQIVVNVEAIETAASIWDWQTSDEEVFLGGGEVDLYDGTTAAAPTSISVTSDSFLSDDGTFNSQFNVAWTNADDAFTDHYVVEWKLASASDYFSQTTKSTPFSIVNLVNNASYNVRVKAVNEIGVSSAYLSATPTSAVDTTAPSLPSSISATAGFQSISLQWTNPSQKDFNNVEVYRATSSGGTYVEVSNVAGGYGAKVEHLDGDLADATAYFYKLKSVDLTGNKSAFSGIVTQTTYKIDTANIEDDAVDTDQIADDAVTNPAIATDAVNQDSIAANSVTANEIVAGTITATEIAANTITASQIAAGTITASQIAADSITVDKLSGDVTEVYPVGQYYYTALTSSAATMGSFTLPAPELGILKRQRIDVNVLFYIVNANQTAAAQSSIIFTVQKKSKGVNAVTVGTVTSESTAIAYNQVVSIPGNQLDKVDVSGGVAASADASGSNEPAYIQAVYYDVTADKTYIQCSAYTTLFSNGNTLYFSDSKFTSAGTWVTPSTTETIFIPTPPDVGAGSGYASVYLPFKMSYGQTTTATDYRVRSHVSSAQSGVTYTAQRMVGTLENIS